MSVMYDTKERKKKSLSTTNQLDNPLWLSILSNGIYSSQNRHTLTNEDHSSARTKGAEYSFLLYLETQTKKNFVFH